MFTQRVDTPLSRWDQAQARRDYDAAYQDGPQDLWVPAGCGDEVPALRGGRWTLYVWNPAQRQHGYLDLSTDVVTVDDGWS